MTLAKDVNSAPMRKIGSRIRTCVRIPRTSAGLAPTWRTAHVPAEDAASVGTPGSGGGRSPRCPGKPAAAAPRRHSSDS